MKREVFPSLTLTVTPPGKGQYNLRIRWVCGVHLLYRALEYLSREDADRAVKDLDGKDLRGRPVRVAYDTSVCDRLKVIFYF